MNPNIEYERFALEVYQHLLNYHHVCIKKVQHNIKLKGLSGCEHQIDVYWEYVKNGVNHQVAIECKNYNKRVPKEKVCAFQGVLADLGDVEGIMVSKEGLQEGAKKYAKEDGVLLKELRPPRDEETIIGAVEHNIHSTILHRLFLIDEEWASEHHFNIAGHRRKMDLFSLDNNQKLVNETHVPLLTTDDIVRNAKGDYIISLDSLEPEIPDHSTDDFPHVFPFENAYVTTPWGSVKILEVKFDLEIKDQKKTFAIDAGDFVKAILKDAFSGVIQQIPKD